MHEDRWCYFLLYLRTFCAAKVFSILSRDRFLPEATNQEIHMHNTKQKKKQKQKQKQKTNNGY